jgi:hypothetical protein
MHCRHWSHWSHWSPCRLDSLGIMYVGRNMSNMDALYGRTQKRGKFTLLNHFGGELGLLVPCRRQKCYSGSRNDRGSRVLSSHRQRTLPFAESKVSLLGGLGLVVGWLLARFLLYDGEAKHEGHGHCNISKATTLYTKYFRHSGKVVHPYPHMLVCVLSPWELVEMVNRGSRGDSCQKGVLWLPNRGVRVLTNITRAHLVVSSKCGQST